MHRAFSEKDWRGRGGQSVDLLHHELRALLVQFQLKTAPQASLTMLTRSRGEALTNCNLRANGREL
eukprot:8334935-Pyramimonas_sp.AAC.1